MLGAGEAEALGERSIILPLTVPVLAALRAALVAPDKRIFSFSLEPTDAAVFAEVTEAYLLHHLERDFDTLHFYRSVAEPPTRRTDPAGGVPS